MRNTIKIRHPEKLKNKINPPIRKPKWIRVKAPNSASYQTAKRLINDIGLNTVCEEAACPNIGECWSKKHVTVMILGSICTRACAFCNVATGKPNEVDLLEPEKLAASAKSLGMRHIVITSVDRDDLPDGGADQFVRCIKLLKKTVSNLTVEVLTPDFRNF